MNDYYVKRTSPSESEKISWILELGLKNITLIDNKSENEIKELVGKHSSYLELNPIRLYDDVLSKFYWQKSSTWSKGIYAFWCSGIEFCGLRYTEYLKNELQEIFKLCGVEQSSFVRKIYNSVEKYISDNYYEVDEFSLLHGDLYLGNILTYNNEYKLIDFEFVRYGPKNLEIAFVLFWDIISEDNEDFRQKRFNKSIENISAFVKCGILNRQDLIEIIELYVPIILLCAFSFANKGDYEAGSNIIAKGAKDFWNEEYQIIQGLFYEK